MIRSLYSFAMWAAQPLLRRKLARRGVQEPGYLEAIEERFGHYGAGTPASSGWVWVHAVSMGETRAAAILVRALRRQMPGMRLLLTHGTATGRAEGKALLQPGDMQVWQPWDTPGAVRRFLAQFQPTIGILMETEVWPNMVAVCQQQGVPLVLANARLNAHSLRKAERVGWLARPAFGGLAAVWAQSQADADRLRQLGAPVQGIFGNVKFDATPDTAQIAQGRAWRAAGGRPVVMLASAREGEEAEFLAALKRFMPLAPAAPAQEAPDLVANNAAGSVQWLIVPRHPQRFDDVAALVQQHGFSVSRRSSWGQGAAPAVADVWLGDSMGEMALYYGLGHVALLGGSFAPLGGQNLIEAAACGCPIVTGPSVFNFQEAATLAQQAGAAFPVASMAQGVQLAVELAQDEVRFAQARAAAEQFATAHRGAADRTAQAVQTLLSSPR